MSSQCDASIAVIQANAAATSRVLLSSVQSSMFNYTQQNKARVYEEMMEEVGWTNEELVQYLKIKTMRSHRNDKLMLGIKSDDWMRGGSRSPASSSAASSPSNAASIPSSSSQLCSIRCRNQTSLINYLFLVCCFNSNIDSR